MKKLIPILLLFFTAGSIFFMNSETEILDRSNDFEFEKEEKEEDKNGPNDWMYSQRAYPDNDFSLEKYRAAISLAKKSKTTIGTRDASWEQAGPINIGGRITDIAIDPSNMDTYYAGSSVGGVYKSTDGGTNWDPIFDDAGASSIGNIGISASNPQVLYVGTGEANGSATSGAFFGDGVYKTIDGGTNWEHVGLENSQHIGRIVVNPQDENEVFVAAAGKLYGKSDDKGLYKSTDGGQSWDQIFFLSDSTSCIDVAIHPDNSNIIYACMWERTRKAWARDYGGVTSGIYRSVDGGQNWDQLTNGLPASDTETGRIGITISPSNPNILYASFTTNSITNTYNGIYRSNDGGDSWTMTAQDDISYVFSSFGWFFGNVRVSPTNPDIVYLMGVSLMRSVNGGVNWADITSMHVDQHGLEIHPMDPNRVIAGNDGGVYISTNLGDNWIHNKTIANTQFYNVEIDPIETNYLFGGTQDNNTIRTSGALEGYDRIIGGDGFHVRVDPTDNNFVYGESQWGNLRRSEDRGDNFSNATFGIDGSDRTNWNTPFTLDPNNPQIMYYGSNKLYRSTDRALSWFPISGDLTKGQHPSGSQSYGTLTTIDVCKANSDYIAVGSDDGNVQITFNGGDDWLNVADDLPNRYITTVAYHPEDCNTLFVTLSGYRSTDYLPHVLKMESVAGGWQDISGDLPEVPVNDIIIDPMDPNNVFYIANDVGVWSTNNGGNSWEVFGTGMPLVVVNDLVLHEESRKMAAGTFGRSMFTLTVPEVMVSNNEEVVVDQSFKIIPNPVQNEMTISFTLENSLDGQIELYDLQGKLVRTITTKTFDTGINEVKVLRNGLAIGQYIVKLKFGRKVLSELVVFI